jgi:hypothetical protein
VLPAESVLIERVLVRFALVPRLTEACGFGDPPPQGGRIVSSASGFFAATMCVLRRIKPDPSAAVDEEIGGELDPALDRAAQLEQGTVLELADALLADAELAAELL